MSTETDDLEAEITPVQRRGQAGPADFYAVDLHVHTPGSHDVKEDVSPTQFVDRAIESGLDLIAVTDHDSPGWYEEINDAAVDRELTVLPGVEITTAEGSERNIHLTAIFPRNKSSKIQNLLIEIGIDPGEAGQNDNFAEESIQTIYDEIEELGGVPILAHIDTKCGADFEIERSSRIRERIFDPESVGAVEVHEIEDTDRSRFDEYAIIQSSDAHRTSALGQRRTLVKMAEPSFEGIRMAFQDPDSRIRLDMQDQTHPAVHGIKWDGGFFDGRHVRFSAHLNALIGGKGAGKSTIIEHLRYAFDLSPNNALVENHDSLVESTLRPDGTVEVHIDTADGVRYVVRRAHGEPPEIFAETGERVLMDIDEFREEYFDLAVYGQGEFLEMARSDSSQMELLDDQFQLAQYHKRIDDILLSLDKNGSEIQDRVAEAEQLRAATSEFGQVKEQVRRMEEAGIKQYIDDRERWDEERRFFEQRIDLFGEIQEELADIRERARRRFGRLDRVEEPANPRLVADATDASERTTESILERLTTVEQQIEDDVQAFERLKNDWDQEQTEREERLQSLSKEIEEDVGVDIDQYLQLKEQLEQLKQKREELRRVESELTELRESRSKLLEEFEEARSELTAARQEQVERLNGLLGEIEIELNENQGRDRYVEWVTEQLDGSNVRYDDRERIATELDPRELAEAVNKERQERLEQLGLTSTAARNVVAHDPLRDRLHELQVLPLEDRPTIKMKDRGQLKPLDDLSEGQKCTALLSIVLLEGGEPLVVDEPEDNLDNASIRDTVVRVLREVKHDRQILTATHNANIPVLGDAELIASLKPADGRGFISNRGPIEHPPIRTKVQEVLEGGVEAFKDRGLRYGYD